MNPAQSSPATSSVNNSLRLSASSRGTSLAIGTITACVSDAAPSLRMVNAAAERIYQSWLPHVGEVEAREQADEFVRRCAHLVSDFVLTERELDQVLDAVADAMDSQP